MCVCATTTTTMMMMIISRMTGLCSLVLWCCGSYADDQDPTIRPSSNYYGDGIYGSFARTVDQVYQRSVNYMFYNDEPLPPFGAQNISCYPWEPEGEACQKKYAHMKGVVAWDEYGHGFWLIHSFPLFPCGPGAAGSLAPGSSLYKHFSAYCNLQKSEYWGPNDAQTIHAQNALCVSFNGWDAFNRISCLLGVDRPVVYDSRMTASSKSKLPLMYSVSQMDYTVSLPESCNVTYDSHGREPLSSVDETLVSAGGQHLIGFSTSLYFKADLYADLIAPALAADIYSETWWEVSPTSPTDTLPNQCEPPYRVFNVSHMSFGSGQYQSWNNHLNFPCSKCGPCFSSSEVCGSGDHSKWALSDAIYCGADKNRSPSQETRGGGALCLPLGADNGLITSLTSAQSPYSC
jgi:hypothetical protein